MTCFNGNEAKKNQNGQLKKNSFSSSTNSQYFFMKFLWFGPWVSIIDWCKGHWCSSTYMAVRLSDISSKSVKKCIFCFFWPFLFLKNRARNWSQYLICRTPNICISKNFHTFVMVLLWQLLFSIKCKGGTQPNDFVSFWICLLPKRSYFKRLLYIIILMPSRISG